LAWLAPLEVRVGGEEALVVGGAEGGLFAAGGVEGWAVGGCHFWSGDEMWWCGGVVVVVVWWWLVVVWWVCVGEREMNGR